MPSINAFDIASHCLLASFIDEVPVFIGADGCALLPIEGKELTIGEGIASTALSPCKKFILTGGEDGRLCQIEATGEIRELARLGTKWLTALTCGPDNSFATAAGRMIFAFDGKNHHEWIEERSVEGLKFAPKGLRLGVACYNEVNLHWLGTESKPQRLEWKGAHNALTFSPDGKFLVTAMQENALHGWRLSDGQHLRMSGYPGKIKSWSWSVKGHHLATSGAMAAIVWPFLTKDGPMGKSPLELGTRANTMVTSVSCHPVQEMVAIGYEDGMILFARFLDNREVVLRQPGKGAITTMTWDEAGLRLVFGSDHGECGLIDIAA